MYGITNIQSFTMFDKTTGKELCSGNCNTEVEITSKSHEVQDNVLKRVYGDRINQYSATINMNVLDFNKDAFDKLFKQEQTSKQPYKVVAVGVDYRSRDKFLALGAKVVQMKTHKSKRINKKWLKKYGLRVTMNKVKIDTLK